LMMIRDMRQPAAGMPSWLPNELMFEIFRALFDLCRWSRTMAATELGVNSPPSLRWCVDDDDDDEDESALVRAAQKLHTTAPNGSAISPCWVVHISWRFSAAIARLAGYSRLPRTS